MGELAPVRPLAAPAPLISGPRGELGSTVLADPVFEGIAVTDTARSVAAAEGRLPQNIIHLDSSRLVADAIIAAHSPG